MAIRTYCIFRSIERSEKFLMSRVSFLRPTILLFSSRGCFEISRSTYLWISVGMSMGYVEGRQLPRFITLQKNLDADRIQSTRTPFRAHLMYLFYFELVTKLPFEAIAQARNIRALFMKIVVFRTHKSFSFTITY